MEFTMKTPPSLGNVKNLLRGTLVTCVLVGIVACGGDKGPKSFSLTASSGIGGSISPSSIQATEGSTVSFTITPEAIYTIGNVTGCGGVLTGNTYSISAVKGNCTVNASFNLKPLELTIAAVPSSLDENETYQFLINSANIRDNAIFTVTEQEGSNFTNASIADNNLVINTKEVDRDRTVNLLITLQDGDNTNRKITNTVSVKINNSSFEPALNLIHFINSQKQRILENTEERALLRNLLSVLYLIDANFSDSSLDFVLNPETTAALESAFSGLVTDNYTNGLESDTRLLAAYEHFQTQLTLRNNEIRPVLTTVFEKFSDQLDAIALPDVFVLAPELNSASFYIGNSLFGSNVEDKWVFKPEFQYLNFLLQQHSDSN